MKYNEFDLLTQQLCNKLYQPIHDIDALDQWKIQMITLIEHISDLKISASAIDLKIDNTSLDPTDWFSARVIAHRTLDSAIHCIQSIADQPVWQPIPDEVRSAILEEPCPEESQALSNVCNDVFSHVMPYIKSHMHPRFWGWVTGEGTFGGMLADMLAAALNVNAVGSTHSAVLIEQKVIHWMREIFGFPKDDHGGLLLTGTSAATIICLAAARRRCSTDVQENGMIDRPRLILYASTETHMCISKALELMGLGTKSMHLIPTKEDFSIDIDQLKENIDKDRKNGLIPFCIVGNAGNKKSEHLATNLFSLVRLGTVNTGAFDDLAALAAIARSENLWFHVDGAFGSLVILDPQRRHLVRGIEEADSLAFDFHKWLHCPYAAGCALVRDGHDLLSTFSVHQSYLANGNRGHTVPKPWYCDLGFDLSRPFPALKVWMTLKEHGIRRFGQKIAENCEQAQYLASLLEKHQSFIRVLRPVSLNIVNFRMEPEELSEADAEFIDEFNNELLADIQLSGVAVPSVTRLWGRVYIRICIVSHRCVMQDFDVFVNHLLSLYRIRREHSKQLTNSID